MRWKNAHPGAPSRRTLYRALSCGEHRRVSTSIVYVDGLLLRSQLDRACGHLCLCALAVITQQHGRVCSDAETVVLWVGDLLWSVCASAEIVGTVSSIRTRMPVHVKVFVACAFVSTHVLFRSSAMSLIEMHSRAVLLRALLAHDSVQSLRAACGPQHVNRAAPLRAGAPCIFIPSWPAYHN